jgi:methylthioribose-1-phosphate isomerase
MFFNKKLRPSLSVSENESYSNGKNINSALITRLSTSYILMKKHNFSLSLVGADRSSKNTGTTSKLNEFTGTLGYSYNF